jgi:hypothetical protein
MNITRETIKETLRTIMAEETEYQTFFKKALEKAGKSIPSMSDEEKKEFFNKIDAAWNAKGEKNEGNAFGAAVVAAKEKGEDEFEVGDKTYKVEESAGCSCGCGGCSESVNEEFKSKSPDFEKVYALFDKKDYFNAKGLAKTQIGNFERALQRNDRGAQQILDKFKGDMDKAKEYITQVISDQKKEQAYGNYMELQQALADVMFDSNDNKVKAGVDFIKRRVHNNSQKYTMALYSALRKKKFTNYKDVHTDIDSLVNESITEGRAFINAARKAKEEGKTEFEFNGKTYPVTLKEEAINERRLGKVSLLKTVENGDSSRVEGVKISPELAFELRMFLQRPMLARTRTGIAIDNAQMKDAIGMLAKVGVEKRLSSGVKNEFSNLLKKYNK